MTALLRWIPGWVWLALVAALLAGLGWLQWERVVAQRDDAIAELQSTRGEVAALESALEWRRENARRLLAALEQREQTLADAHDEIREHREALDRLEDEDAEVRDWLADPVPDAVDDWLRDLRAADGADPGHAAGAAEPDRVASGARGEGDQPPRSPRAAGGL